MGEVWSLRDKKALEYIGVRLYQLSFIDNVNSQAHFLFLRLL